MAKKLDPLTDKQNLLHDPLSLENNCTIEIPLKDDKDDPSGEPDPGCFSSFKQFKYRTWQYMVILKYIICC